MNKKRFLFTSAPLFSHLNWGGYLETAVELKKRGHDVVWAIEKGIVADRIIKTGIEVVEVKTTGWHWMLPYEPPDFTPEGRQAYQLMCYFAKWFPIEQVMVATQSLMDLVHDRNSDIIVSDPFLTAPALATEKLSMPYAIVGLPDVAPDKTQRSVKSWLDNAMKDGMIYLDRLCDMFDVAGKHFIQHENIISPHSPYLHISFFSETWHGTKSHMPQNRFAGGKKSEPIGAPPAWMQSLPSELPLVFISLGSSTNFEPEIFFLAAKAIQTFKAFPIIETYDSQLTVAQAKLGKMIEGTKATPENLRRALSDVMLDEAIKRQAIKHQTEFASLPGVKGAADWLEG